jgi:hypothetical protein
MDQKDRQAHLRQLRIRMLDALSALIERVRDPQARARLEARREQLRSSLERP